MYIEHYSNTWPQNIVQIFWQVSKLRILGGAHEPLFSAVQYICMGNKENYGPRVKRNVS